MAKTLRSAVLFLVALLGLGFSSFSSRPESMRRMESRWLSTHPLSSTGPFKGLLIDLWWVRIHELEQRFRFDEVGRLAEWICYLQPYIPAAWETMSWNIGFNLLAESAPDRAKQVKFLETAIRHMETGLSYNPGSPRLTFYLGWTVYMKTRGGEASFSRELEEILGEKPLPFAYRKVKDSGPITRKAYTESLLLAQLAFLCGEIEECRVYLRDIKAAFPRHAEELDIMISNMEEYGDKK